MVSAKSLVVKPISSQDASKLVKRLHYSGKVVNNSVLHLGVFMNGRLEGAMQFGSPIDKRNVIGLVRHTEWNNFLELNRMAFSPRLPKNSESRAISVAFKIIKKHYPHVEWVLSFADGTQCGDGAIYRASGFLLTAINKNSTIVRLKNGEIKARHGTAKADFTGCKLLPGYQFRYIYFMKNEAKERLTVPVIPFSKIQEIGAGMYKGIKRGLIEEQQIPSVEGSASLTSTLQTQAAS